MDVAQFRRTLKVGQVLFEQNAPNDNMLYVLENGRVAVMVNGQQIATISQSGEVIGEMSVLTNTPRTATVKALETSHVLAFEYDLERLFRQRPDIAYNLTKVVVQRLAETTRHLDSNLRHLQQLQSENIALRHQNSELKRHAHDL